MSQAAASVTAATRRRVLFIILLLLSTAGAVRVAGPQAVPSETAPQPSPPAFLRHAATRSATSPSAHGAESKVPAHHKIPRFSVPPSLHLGHLFSPRSTITGAVPPLEPAATAPPESFVRPQSADAACSTARFVAPMSSGTRPCTRNDQCGHGICALATQRCVCFESAVRGHWQRSPTTVGGHTFDSCSQCQPGYHGPGCQGICPGGRCNPCSSHGACSAGVSGTGACTCDAGSKADPSQPRGPFHAVGHWAGRACDSCAASWLGPNCDIRCVCSSHGTCRVITQSTAGTTGTAECRCEAAWAGTPACTECSPGRYGPQCEPCPGYVAALGKACNGRGRCDDGIQGSGECVCFFPARGLQCEGTCPAGSTCSTCAVSPERCTTCPQPTAGQFCSGRGYCRIDGSCECDKGFAGPNCTVACPAIVGGEPCSGHGRCVSTTGECDCYSGAEGKGFWGGPHCDRCDNFHVGDSCDLACPTGSAGGSGGPAVCHGRGTCAAVTKQEPGGVQRTTTVAECSCATTPVVSCGPSCGSVGIANCAACPLNTTGGPPRLTYGPECQHTCECLRGTCSSGRHGTGACVCPSGYVGAACEVECTGGSATPCSGNGRCLAGETNSALAGQCECQSGFAGPSCALQCPAPGGASCSGHGVCSGGRTGTGDCECFEDSVRGFWAGAACSSCRGGFSGPHCATPCVHGSTVGFACACDLNAGGVGCAFECGSVIPPSQPSAPTASSGNESSSSGSSAPSTTPLVCAGPDHGACSEGRCRCVGPWQGPACNCTTALCRAELQSDTARCNADSGVCECGGNFGGPRCTDCVAEYWGTACTELCMCRSFTTDSAGAKTTPGPLRGSCDRKTGACTCDASAARGFWAGAHCTQCRSGYIGVNCEQQSVAATVIASLVFTADTRIAAASSSGEEMAVQEHTPTVASDQTRVKAGGRSVHAAQQAAQRYPKTTYESTMTVVDDDYSYLYTFGDAVSVFSIRTAQASQPLLFNLTEDLFFPKDRQAACDAASVSGTATAKKTFGRHATAASFPSFFRLDQPGGAHGEQRRSSPYRRSVNSQYLPPSLRPAVTATAFAFMHELFVTIAPRERASLSSPSNATSQREYPEDAARHGEVQGMSEQRSMSTEAVSGQCPSRESYNVFSWPRFQSDDAVAAAPAPIHRGSWVLRGARHVASHFIYGWQRVAVVSYDPALGVHYLQFIAMADFDAVSTLTDAAAQRRSHGAQQRPVTAQSSPQSDSDSSGSDGGGNGGQQRPFAGEVSLWEFDTVAGVEYVRQEKLLLVYGTRRDRAVGGTVCFAVTVSVALEKRYVVGAFGAVPEERYQRTSPTQRAAAAQADTPWSPTNGRPSSVSEEARRMQQEAAGSDSSGSGAEVGRLVPVSFDGSIDWTPPQCSRITAVRSSSAATIIAFVTGAAAASSGSTTGGAGDAFSSRVALVRTLVQQVTRMVPADHVRNVTGSATPHVTPRNISDTALPADEMPAQASLTLPRGFEPTAVSVDAYTGSTLVTACVSAAVRAAQRFASEGAAGGATSYDADCRLVKFAVKTTATSANAAEPDLALTSLQRFGRSEVVAAAQPSRRLVTFVLFRLYRGVLIGRVLMWEAESISPRYAATTGGTVISVRGVFRNVPAFWCSFSAAQSQTTGAGAGAAATTANVTVVRGIYRSATELLCPAPAAESTGECDEEETLDVSIAGASDGASSVFTANRVRLGRVSAPTLRTAVPPRARAHSAYRSADGAAAAAAETMTVVGSGFVATDVARCNFSDPSGRVMITSANVLSSFSCVCALPDLRDRTPTLPGASVAVLLDGQTLPPGATGLPFAIVGTPAGIAFGRPVIVIVSAAVVPVPALRVAITDVAGNAVGDFDTTPFPVAVTPETWGPTVENITAAYTAASNVASVDDLSDANRRLWNASVAAWAAVQASHKVQGPLGESTFNGVAAFAGLSLLRPRTTVLPPSGDLLLPGNTTGGDGSLTPYGTRLTLHAECNVAAMVAAGTLPPGTGPILRSTLALQIDPGTPVRLRVRSQPPPIVDETGDLSPAPSIFAEDVAGNALVFSGSPLDGAVALGRVVEQWTTVSASGTVTVSDAPAGLAAATKPNADRGVPFVAGLAEFRVKLFARHGARYTINVTVPSWPVLQHTHTVWIRSACPVGYGVTGEYACPCMPHATCTTDAVAVDPGYWRGSAQATVAYACSPFAACPGGPQPAACALHYGGPLCDGCDQGFAKGISGTCDECLSDTLNVIFVCLLLCVIVAGLTVVIAYTVQNSDRNNRVLIVGQLFVSHLQTIAVLPYLDFPWPTALVSIAQWIDALVDLRVLDTTFGECFLRFSGFTYTAKFAFQLVLSFALVLAAGFSRAILFLFPDFLRRPPPRGVRVRRRLEVTMGRVLMTALTVGSVFLFQGMLFYALGMLRCREISTAPGVVESFLRADATVRCVGSDYDTVRIVAWPSSLLLLVGTPLALGIVPFLHKHLRPRQRNLRAQAGAFLLGGLNDSAWYWPAVVCARKGLLVAAVVWFDAPIDAHSVTWVLVLYLIGLIYVQPFQKKIHRERTKRALPPDAQSFEVAEVPGRRTKSSKGKRDAAAANADPSMFLGRGESHTTSGHHRAPRVGEIDISEGPVPGSMAAMLEEQERARVEGRNPNAGRSLLARIGSGLGLDKTNNAASRATAAAWSSGGRGSQPVEMTTTVTETGEVIEEKVFHKASEYQWLEAMGTCAAILIVQISTMFHTANGLTMVEALVTPAVVIVEALAAGMFAFYMTIKLKQAVDKALHLSAPPLLVTAEELEDLNDERQRQHAAAKAERDLLREQLLREIDAERSPSPPEMLPSAEGPSGSLDDPAPAQNGAAPDQHPLPGLRGKGSDLLAEVKDRAASYRDRAKSMQDGAAALAFTFLEADEYVPSCSSDAESEEEQREQHARLHRKYAAAEEERRRRAAPWQRRGSASTDSTATTATMGRAESSRSPSTVAEFRRRSRGQSTLAHLLSDVESQPSHGHRTPHRRPRVPSVVVRSPRPAGEEEPDASVDPASLPRRRRAGDATPSMFAEREDVVDYAGPPR